MDLGVREITLLGQIVTSYGKREIGMKDGKSAFVQLIEAVHEIDGLQRLRFTFHTRKATATISSIPSAPCPSSLRAPIFRSKSGSDRMLKIMHRGYTRERFLEIINKLRAVKPEIGLGTDIIVGFPGETEEDFEQTVSLCREVRFQNAFIFKLLTAQRHSGRKDARSTAGND